MKIRRNKLIKAILYFTFKDIRLIKKLKIMSDDELLYELKQYCLSCYVNYDDHLHRFKVINKKKVRY
jgi:hypothetical protein